MLQDLAVTLPELRSAYAGGTTVEAVLREIYRRIESVADPAIFIQLREFSEVLADANELPPGHNDLPLWGVPYVIKDNIDAAGMPTTAGCPAYAYKADRDAFVVALLKSAGALLIGKTNLDQFATGLVGVRSPYGVPKNAIDAKLVPGGSSSGSAVAVAHGIAAFSLGTDTAGSGRVPAALNNIVGLKPSLGALSATGVVPACRTLDTISIFAQTVSDAFEVFGHCAQYDDDDAFARRFAIQSVRQPPSNLRIGVPTQESIEFFGDTAQSEMFDVALDRLRQLGTAIVPLDFAPFFDVARMLYEGAWVAERLSVIDDLLRDQPSAVHPTTLGIISPASELTAVDTFRGIYRLHELRRLAEKSMADVDLLCVPTIPTFYTLDDLDADPIGPNSNLGTYTNFVNLMDLCGIAVPVASRTDGLPGSVTILGRWGRDAFCASVARLFNEVDECAKQAPADTGSIELAVCGAHMSGLPLNGELTACGATFVKATKTAPHYRLYALPGGPPKRPGLLRCEGGGSIDLEVWSLPKTAMGGFLAGVPVPLSIGRVALADGTSPLGFLVEASAVSTAEDITSYGSWRAFVTGVN